MCGGRCSSHSEGGPHTTLPLSGPALTVDLQLGTAPAGAARGHKRPGCCRGAGKGGHVEWWSLKDLRGAGYLSAGLMKNCRLQGGAGSRGWEHRKPAKWQQALLARHAFRSPSPGIQAVPHPQCDRRAWPRAPLSLDPSLEAHLAARSVPAPRHWLSRHPPTTQPHLGTSTAPQAARCRHRRLPPAAASQPPCSCCDSDSRQRRA